MPRRALLPSVSILFQHRVPLSISSCSGKCSSPRIILHHHQHHHHHHNRIESKHLINRLLSTSFISDHCITRNYSGINNQSMNSPTVLSIQSHVVHGYVGNKSSTFPLQILGFEVDNINSVQYSNHVHYKVFKGQQLDGSDLDDIFSALQANDLLKNYTHIQTGYCGSSSFLKTVVEVVRTIKQTNPNIIYVCDPVLGDNDRFYVPEDQLLIYRDELLPMADIITPNQFEAQILSGIKIKSEDDIPKVTQDLHSKGVPCVIITSTNFENDSKLPAYGSRKINDGFQRFKINIPKIDTNFVGTGDLFTALMMAWLHKTDDNLCESLENTVNTLQAVLRRTYQSAQVNGSMNDSSLELKLIQSKSDIENPPNCIKCYDLTINGINND